MTTGFVEKNYKRFTTNSTSKINYFLNDLRSLLDKHNVKLYSHECEVYIEGQGYIGYLEDNIQTVDIVEGEKTLYSSDKSQIIEV